MSEQVEIKERLIVEDLQDRFEQIRVLLKHYLRRHGHRLVSGDMGVAKAEIASTLRLQMPGAGRGLSDILALPDVQQIAAELGASVDRTRRRARACSDKGFDLPFTRVRESFQLTEVEVRLLVAQLAVQVDPDLNRLFRLAWADFTQALPSVGFLAELVAPGGAERRALLKTLEADSPLLRYRLLTLQPMAVWGEQTPKSMLRVAMPGRVAHFLQYGELPSETEVLWRFERGGEAGLPRLYPEGFSEEILSALRKLPGSSFPRVLVSGRAGSGRRLLMRDIGRATGHPLMVVDVQRVLKVRGGSADTVIADALREGLLLKALVLLRNADALDEEVSEREPLSAAARMRLTGLLDQHHQTLVFTAEKGVDVLERRLAGWVELQMRPLEEPRQKQLWVRLLEPDFAPAQAEILSLTLSRQFSLSPGTMKRVVERAHVRARARPEAARKLQADDVMEAVRRSFKHELGSLAQTMSTQLDWSDLVVPPDVKESLDEILAMIRYKATVMGTWGFGKKFERGRGTACLFSGPPGTGKTMTALLLAREFGRQTYRVDLSRIVDKYVGETEKNLGRIFDEAERAQAILLFDEADSLFGARTDGSTANDRYANLEVNYLLQRIEAYEGISILTTNMVSAIDEAFKRRLRFHVPFPFPDEEHRIGLWKSMFPPEAKHDLDPHDWEQLAAFELSGGSIKNAVLRAAFLAAADGNTILMEHLFLAVQRESAKMGHLVGSRDPNAWDNM